MRRFNSWIQTLTGDYWRDRFKPKDLIRTFSHANSVLAMQQDVKLLERYDINELDESRVGKTYVWVPITLDEPEKTGSEDYPYVYTVDSDWIFIYSIYDSYTDPVHKYQNGIEFTYEEGSGKLYFNQEIPVDILDHLYISKGQYAAYRLYDEIGCLLDYARKDSTKYRDSFMPILGAFYKGPTPVNVTAILQELFGNYVTKYGDETVISVADGVITTDKYTYKMDDAHITVKPGDVLYKWQPLTDEVTLITSRMREDWLAKYEHEKVVSVEDGVVTTDKGVYDLNYTYKGEAVTPHIIVSPGDRLYKGQPLSDDILFTQGESQRGFYEWWKDRYVDMFAKYAVDVSMTEELRDYLMSTFLYDAVMEVRIRPGSRNATMLSENKDILNLFYQALPTRTDVFFNQRASILDVDTEDMVLPDYSVPKIRSHIISLYGHPNHKFFTDEELKKSHEQLICNTEIGRPLITPTGENVEQWITNYQSSTGYIDNALVFDKGYWHIFDEQGAANKTEYWEADKDLREFAKYSGRKAPIIEPYYDAVYLRLSTVPDWEGLGLTAGYSATISETNSINTSTVTIDDYNVYVTAPSITAAGLDLTSDRVGVSKVKIRNYGDIGSGMYSSMPTTGAFSWGDVDISSTTDDLKSYAGLTTMQEIPGEYYFAGYNMSSWSLTNALVNKDGLEAYNEGYGYGISDKIYLGLIPKDVEIRWKYSIPEQLDNNSVKLEYSVDNKKTWIEIDTTTNIIHDVNTTWYTKYLTLRRLSANIYLRVTLNATIKYTPVVKQIKLKLLEIE